MKYLQILNISKLQNPCNFNYLSKTFAAHLKISRGKQVEKDRPKLTSFFALEETNRQTHSSTSSSQDVFKSQSSETWPTFDIEDKINHEKIECNSILGPLGKRAKPPGHTG